MLLVASFRNYTPAVVETALASPRARRLGRRHHRQRAVAAEAAPPTSASSSATTPTRPFRSLVAPLCLAQALVVSTGQQPGARRRDGDDAAREAAKQKSRATAHERPARSTSSAWAAPRSTCTASRSAAGSRTCARFAKYLGGSPANTAVGVARLGLKPAMLTRVGDEHNGRFVRERLAAEGVDVDAT